MHLIVGRDRGNCCTGLHCSADHLVKTLQSRSESSNRRP
jgi:hypothetical protein